MSNNPHTSPKPKISKMTLREKQTKLKQQKSEELKIPSPNQQSKKWPVKPKKQTNLTQQDIRTSNLTNKSTHSYQKQAFVTEEFKSSLNNTAEEQIFDELDFLSESITRLLQSAASDNWTEQIKGFTMLSKSSDQVADCSISELKQYLKVHIDNLTNPNPKVMKAAQDSLLMFIEVKSEFVEPRLGEIIPKVLSNIIMNNEQVSTSASDLMNIVCMSYRPQILLKFLSEFLMRENTRLKVVIATLEVLVVLLKEDDEFCQNNANVLETCIRITEIIEENQLNMDVIMPSIAALLAMRDKNYEGTMKAMVFLKSSTLNLIRNLASRFAPDLEQDLITSVFQDQQAMIKGSPAKKPSLPTRGSFNMKKNHLVIPQERIPQRKSIIPKSRGNRDDLIDMTKVKEVDADEEISPFMAAAKARRTDELQTLQVGDSEQTPKNKFEQNRPVRK